MKTPSVGDIVFCLSEGHRYEVLKVLVVDAHGVHACIYAKTYKSIPWFFRTKWLKVAVGHVPLSHEHWKKIDGKVVRNEAVTESELCGYRIWAADDDAGYFN